MGTSIEKVPSLLTIATAVLAFLPRGGGNADISELVDVDALVDALGTDVTFADTTDIDDLFATT